MMAKGRGQSQSPITLPHLKPPEKGFHPIRCHSHRMRSCRSQPQRDADRVGSRGQRRMLSLWWWQGTRALYRRELAFHWLFESSAPLFYPHRSLGGRKREGARGGVALWSESYPWAQGGKTETLAMRAVSPAVCSVSVEFPQAWQTLSVSVISVQGETCTSFNDGAAFATTFGEIWEICSSDQRRMAAGDDRVCKLVAARGPNPAAWGVSTADPGVSEESAKKGLRRRREEIWDAAALAVLFCKTPLPFWRAMAGCIAIGSRATNWAIGSFFCPARTYGRAVSLRDYKIVFSWRGKNSFFEESSMQNEWNIEREHCNINLIR